MDVFLSRLSPGELIPIITLVLGALCALATIIAISWYQIHKTSTTAALKQDMLNRGMSAEEIKTVLEAGLKQ